MLISSIILAALLAALQPGTLGNDAQLTLTFDFPEDTTPEEKKSLVGRQLTLVGYSGLAHGPSFDVVEVEIDARYQIRVLSLKPWIYELKVDGVVRSNEVDAALGPFRIQFDQFFYPQTGQPGFGRVKLERGIDFHGRAVDESGNGVEGARVTARWSRRSIHGSEVQQTVESGPGGAFRFINVPSNMSSIESVKAPWPTARLTKRALATLLGKKEAVEITHAALGPWKGSAPEKKQAKKDSLETLGRGEILGRLQDASGKPMAQASLRLVPLHSPRLSMSESHASLPIRYRREFPPLSQSFRFGPLAPGKYRVTRRLDSLDRHGRVALLQDVEVVAGEVATTTLDERGRRYDDFTNRCYGSVRLDGEPLLAAYVQLRDEIGEEESQLLAFCGRTFARIEPWCATAVTEGQSLVAAAGDLDGDDVDDVFLADVDQVGINQHKVTIKAASGSDGQEFCNHVRTPNGTGWEDLVSLPDLDGDGKGEVLLTSHGFSLLLAEPTVVSVHSGADLSLLYELRQTTSPRAVYEHFGISGCWLDDVNGRWQPSGPRIDDAATAFKVLAVARGDDRPAHPCDTCDLQVPDFDRAPRGFQLSGQCTSDDRCTRVEGQNEPVELFVEDGLKGLFKAISPFALG